MLAVPVVDVIRVWKPQPAVNYIPLVSKPERYFPKAY
ncbi:putative Protein yippee 1, partial [Danaus plexippus plexippus]